MSLLEVKDQEMPKAMIEDMDRFKAFLASQPFCRWSAHKEQEIAMGIHRDHRGASGVHLPPPKNDNAELADALSSMA